MSNNTVYLLLGSNLGDKNKSLSDASTLINQTAGKVVKMSSIYETAAWGKENQPSFYNQGLKITTELPPLELIESLQKIEIDLGRVRHKKWGERTIDIDIIYYNEDIIEAKNLVIPHPGIPNRRFVLIPLCEIDEAYIHPILKKSNAVLLEECKDMLEVKKLL